MSDRGAAIVSFLARAGWGAAERHPLPGDASFRRYERLRMGGTRAMLMDAPPPKENVRPFLAVARWLHARGFSAPDILAADEELGLLVIEDLGDATYTRELARGVDEGVLYAQATDALIALHRQADAAAAPVPPYDDARLLAEAALLLDWFLPAMNGAAVSPAARAAYDEAWRRAFAIARAVPEALVLRDYHADNLMVVAGRTGIAACGLLDFQDAVVGPVSYDLVSLLEDARRDVSPGVIAAMRARYLATFPRLDPAALDASYFILGAQRNAKIIGIFTRLDRRDGKPRYLAHIPRVWSLLEGDLRHPALAHVRSWFDAHVPAALRRSPEAVR
jgi:aminoglycoside/choline kinase family phosphotransferase